MRKTDEQRGDWKEWRRRRAWELCQQGWNQKEIAEALAVTQGAVSQWMKIGREQGEEILGPILCVSRAYHPGQGACRAASRDRDNRDLRRSKQKRPPIPLCGNSRA